MNTDGADLRQFIARHREGDLAVAERGYRDHLAKYPEDATALHFLGLLRTQQGRFHEGIELMDAAVRVDPGYVDAWSNLAIAFFQQKDLDRSEKCCRKAIELRPNFANAWGNLGRALRAKGLGEEALQAWRRALVIDPNMRSVAVPYGQLLYKMNRIDEARAFYGEWCERNPDDALATHMLAASGGAPAPGRASDGYVRTTFDEFADSFDDQLKNLEYKAPDLLHRAAMESADLASAAPFSVLDLGCGTGLCGPLFKPQARRLVGVDLSSRMLSRAAARDCYDQLNFGELTQYLAACPERFDLVLAADVLCYFGDLSSAFAGVRRVLEPYGRFIFSLEASQTEVAPSQGFTLKPHGRYEHDQRYVEAELRKAGLRAARTVNDTLRFESRNPVIGLIVTATHSS